MKKVGKIGDENQSSNKEFDLDAELSIIIKNNQLPPRIVQKIGENPNRIDAPTSQRQAHHSGR